MAGLDPSVNPLIPSLLGNMAPRAETKKKTEKTTVRGASFFSKILDNNREEQGETVPGELRNLPVSEESVNLLLDGVRSAGDDLKRRPHQNEILRYKQAVRNFMHYVLENGYELLQTKGIMKKVKVRGETEWRSKQYTLIQVVDQKLEKLAAEILSGQAEQLRIAARLDEINGLLVDMME